MRVAFSVTRLTRGTVRGVGQGIGRPRIPVYASVVAVLLALGLGAALGRHTAPVSIAGEPPHVQQDFSLFWQVWNLAEQHFVNAQALNTEQMVEGAINGMLAALNDPGHTRFLTAAQAKQEQQLLNGQFVGIGVEIAFQKNRPVIIAPIHGSPAERAGLKAGDVIVTVDGTDTAGMTPTELSTKIQGPAGTPVTLGVLAKGAQQLTIVTIMRAAVNVPAVLSHAFSINGHALADIQIAQFATHANSQLRSTLLALQKQGLAGAVIDLRNDPGGYRDEAITVASEFLTHGNVLLEQNRAGQRTAFPVKPGAVAPTLPIVVLINAGTASSAEIFAGAIQDQQRGVLVGETTFGTGTVLQQFPLQGGAALLLGVDEWLTPDGHLIWHHGIIPNVTVPLAASVPLLTPDRESSLTPDQLLHNPDLQFARALQELLTRLAPAG